MKMIGRFFVEIWFRFYYKFLLWYNQLIENYHVLDNKIINGHRDEFVDWYNEYCLIIIHRLRICCLLLIVLNELMKRQKHVEEEYNERL